MASFSTSEISNMISRKRYEIKRGDTLNTLAERFQESFPSLARLSKSTVADMIFNENSSNSFKDRNKDVIIEGTYLELNFLLEARRREFRFDHSAKEYVFTNEDQLAFVLNERDFWDHFCRCDRDCGEFLRESLKEQGQTSLPEKISLNHKLQSTSSHKDLADNLKNEIGSFNKVVKLDSLSEKMLKKVGYSSPSNSMIQELSKKLIDENRLTTCSHEKCTCIPTKQLDKLSMNPIYKIFANSPLTSDEKSNLEKGFYIVSDKDKMIFLVNIQVLWEKLIKETGLSSNEFHKIREKFGYSQYKLEGNKIFVPSKQGLEKIKVSFGSGTDEAKFDSKSYPIIKQLALHANYLGGDIDRLVITSTQRDKEKQAELMVPYLMKTNSTLYPTVRSWLYKTKQTNGDTYYEQFKKNIITEQEFENIIEQLALKHVTENKDDYLHVGDNGKAFDIGPVQSGHSTNDREYFNKSMTLLEGKDLDSQSLLYGERGEEAYHIVITN